VPPRREIIEQLEGEGVSRVIFGLPPVEKDAALAVLQRCSDAVKA
jgi:hypothetical protein